MQAPLCRDIWRSANEEKSAPGVEMGGDGVPEARAVTSRSRPSRRSRSSPEDPRRVCVLIRQRSAPRAGAYGVLAFSEKPSSVDTARLYTPSTSANVKIGITSGNTTEGCSGKSASLRTVNIFFRTSVLSSAKKSRFCLMISYASNTKFSRG